MQPSIFTRIINGDLPSYKIYEDDQCLAILDILPTQPGHTLLFPKQPIEFLWDVPDDLYHHLWDVAHKIADHQRDVLHPHRVGLKVDGEAVPHAHIHIIPLNGEHDLSAPRPSEPDHDALKEMAAKITLPA